MTVLYSYKCKSFFGTSFLLTLELMLNMGYTRQAVEDSITHQKYDDVQATYLLLGRRTSDVSQTSLGLYIEV